MYLNNCLKPKNKTDQKSDNDELAKDIQHKIKLIEKAFK